MNDLLAKLEELDKRMTPGPWYSYEGELMMGPLEHGFGPRLAEFNVERVRFGGVHGGFTSEAVNESSACAKLRNMLPEIIEALRSISVRRP